MSPAERETRQLLSDPGIRAAVRALVDHARRDYIKATEKAEREIAAKIASPYCPWCGGVVVRARARKFYCSDNCRKRANDRRVGRRWVPA